MDLASISSPASPSGRLLKQQQPTLRQAFDSFVGETFYSQMIKSMRSSVGKAPYFHGGRTEDAFQSQLDQVLSEKLTENSATKFSGPMFDLFNLQRS